MHYQRPPAVVSRLLRLSTDRFVSDWNLTQNFVPLPQRPNVHFCPDWQLISSYYVSPVMRQIPIHAMRKGSRKSRGAHFARHHTHTKCLNWLCVSAWRTNSNYYQFFVRKRPTCVRNICRNTTTSARIFQQPENRCLTSRVVYEVSEDIQNTLRIRVGSSTNERTNQYILLYANSQLTLYRSTVYCIWRTASQTVPNLKNFLRTCAFPPLTQVEEV